LLAGVGAGNHTAREVFNAVFPSNRPTAPSPDDKAAVPVAKPKPKVKARRCRSAV